MGRSLSPIIRRELANLDKDADSRKSAMKALKSYVKDLDSQAIPHFLAQVSETKETSSSYGEFTISLYELLARVHGVNIVPQIGNIMTTIVKTLSSSAGSFALHQACSKVIPAIARYAIEPTTPEDRKRHVIRSLYKPLCDSLMASQDSLSSGSALCLKALVESDNWRFASDEMVNEVCLKVAGALGGKRAQTNSVMGLAMSLAKHNALIVEPYARLLIQSGLRTLNAEVSESNSQKRLLAIHMISFLMKSLHPRSITSELHLIIEELEKCQYDHMAFVKGAAFEAMQTARRLIVEKEARFEKEHGSCTGSNFSTRSHGGSRNASSSGDRSPISASPESHTLNSFGEYGSYTETPFSMRQLSHNSEYDYKRVNRKLWSSGNGGVDVSLEDGLLSEVTHGSPLSNGYARNYENSENTDDCSEEFRGFLHLQRNHKHEGLRITTPSPQRSRTQINVDNVKIFTTPRKLIHSLQDPNDAVSDHSEKQIGRLHGAPSSMVEGYPTTKHHQNGTGQSKSPSEGDLQLSGGSESVSSTEGRALDADHEVTSRTITRNKAETHKISLNGAARKPILGIFAALLAAIISLLWIDNRREGYNLVPT